MSSGNTCVRSSSPEEQDGDGNGSECSWKLTDARDGKWGRAGRRRLPDGSAPQDAGLEKATGVRRSVAQASEARKRAALLDAVSESLSSDCVLESNATVSDWHR